MKTIILSVNRSLSMNQGIQYFNLLSQQITNELTEEYNIQLKAFRLIEEPTEYLTK